MSGISIFVLEVSSDEGKTWSLEQQFGLYRTRQRAEARAERETKWHVEQLTVAAYKHGWIYRAREYAPAKEGNA